MTDGRAATADAPHRRGRHRSEEADQSILDAATAVLAEQGFANFTIAAVVARAGVSSATVYRRWTNKHDLVASALHASGRALPEIDNGSLSLDVAALVQWVGDQVANGPVDLLQVREEPELLELARSVFVAPRQVLLRRILERARDRGEVRCVPPLEEAWSFVIGPLHNWLYIKRKPLTEAYLRQATAYTVAGLRALAECGH
jgi:AcrR family transcriptional regulator